MKTLIGWGAGMLLFAAGGVVCPAQSAAVPFKQIERETIVSSRLNVPSGESAMNGPIAEYLSASASSSSAYMRPTYKRERTLDTKFFLVNGLHLGLAALDIGLTQHCIAEHRCREGNPLMPSSLGGQLALDAAFVSSSTFISFRLKKQNSKQWWFSPAVGIGAHTAGAVTGLLNR